MTPQANILSGMMAYSSKELGVCVNPFYGADEEKIKRDLEYAKEIYIGVFKQFIAAWVVAGDKKHPPPKHWEILVV